MAVSSGSADQSAYPRPEGRGNSGAAQAKGTGEGSSHDSHGIVVKDCGHVFGGELVCGVADEQTSLADGTVADDDAPRAGGQLVGGGECMPGRRRGLETYLIVATTMLELPCEVYRLGAGRGRVEGLGALGYLGKQSSGSAVLGQAVGLNKVAGSWRVSKRGVKKSGRAWRQKQSQSSSQSRAACGNEDQRTGEAWVRTSAGARATSCAGSSRLKLETSDGSRFQSSGRAGGGDSSRAGQDNEASEPGGGSGGQRWAWWAAEGRVDGRRSRGWSWSGRGMLAGRRGAGGGGGRSVGDGRLGGS